MKIALATYPWAYFTPGGGEIQVEKLFEELRIKDIDVQKLTMESQMSDIYFSCMCLVDFCNYLKYQKKLLTVYHYGYQKIKSLIIL